MGNGNNKKNTEMKNKEKTQKTITLYKNLYKVKPV